MDLVREASRNLVSAVRRGELWAVEGLLQEGADPNWVCFGNPTTTALHLAAKRRDAEMLEVLIDASGDLTNVVLGSTPLEAALGAVGNGKSDPESDAFCVWMLSLGEQLSSMDSQAVAKAITLASARGCIQTLAALISPPYLSLVGNSEAVRSCSPWWDFNGLRWLKDLVSEGDVDVRDAVVHWVVFDNNIEGLRHLVRSGFDVNFRLGSTTPILEVMSRTVPEDVALAMLRVLLGAGASPVEASGVQVNALEAALSTGHHQAARMLVDGGHVGRLSDRALDDCLGGAVKRGDAGVVALLLEWGADHTIRLNGKSLLELTPPDSDDVRRLLRSYRLEGSLEQALGEVSGESLPARSVSVDPL